MTTLYTCTVYIKVGGELFRPLAAREEIAEVDVFTVRAEDPDDAAERMFQIGQKEFGNDDAGKPYPRDVRSVSVGDLIKVATPGRLWFYACRSFGWQEIPEPTNPVVPLAGTTGTSRPAEEAR